MRPNRLLYVVSHAYPYSSNGYAVRTHHVAKALRRAGVEVLVLTRPGRPWDISGFDDGIQRGILDETIDGVRYLCLPEPSRVRPQAAESWQLAAKREIEDFCRIFRPDVVMAASNWETALPAQRAASDLELPFYYEVRGFWELSKAAREPDYEESKQFTIARKKETEVALNARRVYTLTSQMMEELVQRGVGADNVSLLPNGIDSVAPKSSEPAHRAEHTDGLTIGYAGSFAAYEGLDELIQAFAKLCNRITCRLLLVGSSAEMNSTTDECSVTETLRALTEELGISSKVEFSGRVLPENIDRYYNQIDIVVIPRKPMKVCEIVSPLKPLEAAAKRKALLVSDVGPLEDMAKEGGFLTFKKGNLDDLINKLNILCRDDALREKTACSAYQWVHDKRTFDAIVQPLVEAIQSDVRIKQE